MVKIGTITGHEIRTNKNGAAARIILQVQLTNPDDIQSVELVTLPGQKEIPINGTRCYILEVSESHKIAFAVDDGIISTVDTGEKELYSLDSDGVIQAFIKLLETGIIEVNGNNDFAVRFNALETALQTMLTALNADIVTAGGSGGTTLDISAAKVDEVKLI